MTMIVTGGARGPPTGHHLPARARSRRCSPTFEFNQRVQMTLWEDMLDAARAARRPDLERACRSPRSSGASASSACPPTTGSRKQPGPPPTVRLAVVVPAWNQPQYLAGAVRSALDQEIETGRRRGHRQRRLPRARRRTGSARRCATPTPTASPTCTSPTAASRPPATPASATRSRAGRRSRRSSRSMPTTCFRPHTLAKLAALLEEHPEVAWASPSLEFFGAEEGEWRVPGPYLPYRQLLMNQCDAGSLIRRSVFDRRDRVRRDDARRLRGLGVLPAGDAGRLPRPPRRALRLPLPAPARTRC